MVGLEHTIVVHAAPTRVLNAFFDPDALVAWWGAVRAVTTPRPLGVFAVQWARTDYDDDVLGPLGGTFYGTVVDFNVGQDFFVGGAYWLPPEGEPIGPMALSVAVAVEGQATHVRVIQSGYEESLRWSRYYTVVGAGWKLSLESLKRYLEKDARV